MRVDHADAAGGVAVEKDPRRSRPGRQRLTELDGEKLQAVEPHTRHIAVAYVTCGHVDRAAAETDVRAGDPRLSGRDLRHHLERAVAKERTHAELLVDDR